MKRLWIVAGAALIAAAAGCNRWDENPYPPPYYQQPYYYPQPSYQYPACPPTATPAATTYVQPCAPATVRPAMPR